MIPKTLLAVRFLFALLLAAFALSPQPARAQFGGDEGTPILIVEGYSTVPAAPRSGEEFTLNLTVKNIGTKHADSVIVSVNPGSDFVQVGPPAAITKLEPDPKPELNSATVSLRVRAPKVSGGAYDLGLSLSYRVGTSGEYTTQRTVGITLTAGSGVAGKPQVIITSATPRAAPHSAGLPFEVDFVLRNAGTRTAHGISASLKLSDFLSPAQGSGSAQLGDLEPGQSKTLTLSLVLNKASASGRVAQTVLLEYRDPSGVKYTAEETASLDLGGAGRGSPQLIITGYATEPQRPAPGDTFTLTVSVTNVGAGVARRVLLRLGDETGLKPFIPLKAGSAGYAEEIAAGATATFTHTLLMDGAAAGGAYALKASLIYENGLGEAKSSYETLGLLAPIRPQVSVTLTKPLPEPVNVGQPFDIAVEVVNIGRQRLDVSTVEVVSADLQLTKNALYVGPLDPSISGGLTAKATALKAGAASFRVIVHYRDEVNQMQTLEQTLTVNVETANASAPVTTVDTSTVERGWWQVVLQFFGLGG